VTAFRRELGLRAEAAVAEWLTERGRTVLERNLRLSALEVDIVAREGALILVVEVRHRGLGARTSSFGSISETKRQRLRRAARYLWDRRYCRDPSVQRLRIDAASVWFTPHGAHVEYCPAAVVMHPSRL
jgi:putative endonuclease